MNSLERTRRAIHFQGPDHIPHHLPDGKENDILWLWPAAPPEVKPWTAISSGQEEMIDCWGVTWQRADSGSFGEAKNHPIRDITRHAEYHFPGLNEPDKVAKIIRLVEENNRSQNPKYCLGVMPFNSLNEGTHNVMGLENMFAAYYEHTQDLKDFIARLAREQENSIRLLAQAGCHGVMGYDDWGLQDRQMIGNDLIEEFFLPHYRKNWKLAHDLGLEVWMHSCGYIIDVLPLFIDAGLNVIQMDQQENMGLEDLDTKVGGKIAFWCPVDIQKTMISGTVNDIRNYVKRMMATLGRHRGGLISMAYSSPAAVNHTPEKIAAMCVAFREYGVY